MTSRLLNRVALLVLIAISAFPAYLQAQPKTKINPKDGAEMIYIPAGEFIMGNNEGHDNQKPQRTVELDGYWIYKYPITVAQYAAYANATGRSMPEPPRWKWIDNHPMVNVTWEEAADYLRWAGVGFPTEAQWEKAARGTDGRAYPWGSDALDIGKNANYGNKIGRTTPVSQYPEGASPYGVMDMAGNVWEWCADWFNESYYKNAPTKNPLGPQTGEYRVLRGGTWHNTETFCRSTFRGYGFGPSIRSLVLGFRGVALDSNP